MRLRNNKSTSSESKCIQMDVLLDVYHFLREYEKNVRVLNEYNAQHKFDKER